MEITNKQLSEFEEIAAIPKGFLMEIIKATKTAKISRIAVVGGAVRDVILHKLHKKQLNYLPDLDLVVEGSASDLAKIIQDQLGEERLGQFTIHTVYDTAEIKLDGFSIDIASARIEKYLAPGYNPKVIKSLLENDLYRRDFTVNAMAIELSNLKLIDPFNGRDSLDSKQLRFIHSKSFKEDPTRIIRGARYAARLNFELSTESLNQVKQTLIAWPWEWKPGDKPELAPPALGTRLRMEMELLLNNEPWQEALKCLQQWGALLLLDKQLQEDKKHNRRLHWASKLGLDPLTVFIAGSSNPAELGARLQLPSHQQKLLIEKCKLEEFLHILNKDKVYLNWPPSTWCRELEGNEWSAQAVAIVICSGSPIWRKLLRWFIRWRLAKSPISPKKLIENGWEPGPKLGVELERLRHEYIDRLDANN